MASWIVRIDGEPSVKRIEADICRRVDGVYELVRRDGSVTVFIAPAGRVGYIQRLDDPPSGSADLIPPAEISCTSASTERSWQPTVRAPASSFGFLASGR